MVTETVLWSVGDRVVHTGRPEWGPGQVTTASSAVHEGQPCQRLTIRFERAGLKTLSTAFAKLDAAPGYTPKPASERPKIAALATRRQTPIPLIHNTGRADPEEKERDKPADDNWGVDHGSLQGKLERVPADAADPFSSIAQRLKTTLRLYEFHKDGASLIGWATAQTGLGDPLSQFSRPELERIFDRFRRNLDAHLAALLAELKKQPSPDADEVLANAAPQAQQVLRRMNVRR